MKRTIPVKTNSHRNSFLLGLLIMALIASLIINIWQGGQIRWLKTPYNQFITINSQLQTLRREMTKCFIEYKTQKSIVFDPLQEEVFQRGQALDSLLTIINQQPLGGNW